MEAPGTAASLVQSLRLALRHDLNTPEALKLVDDAAAGQLDDVSLVNRAISALLGVAL
jgi:L-cysteine:1D-myo-inositol 2-amino-2-deoxy-alpha-D-glucopyranoside ligase